jgi:hypothetical protein
MCWPLPRQQAFYPAELAREKKKYCQADRATKEYELFQRVVCQQSLGAKIETQSTGNAE